VSCDELVELVTAYLEGALDAATERRMVAHLDECPGCERYLDQIRETIRALGRLPVTGLPDGTRERLLAAFRAYRSP
jgi:anti-sigma factor RsiW